MTKTEKEVLERIELYSRNPALARERIRALAGLPDAREYHGEDASIVRTWIGLGYLEERAFVSSQTLKDRVRVYSQKNGVDPITRSGMAVLKPGKLISTWRGLKQRAKPVITLLVIIATLAGGFVAVKEIVAWVNPAPSQQTSTTP